MGKVGNVTICMLTNVLYVCMFDVNITCSWFDTDENIRKPSHDVLFETVVYETLEQ